MGADNKFGNHQEVLRLINHKLTLCYICQKKKLIQHSCFLFSFNIFQEHLFWESGVGVCIDWCCHSEQNVQLWNLHRKLCPHFRVIFSQTTITTFQGRETDINKENRKKTTGSTPTRSSWFRRQNFQWQEILRLSKIFKI